MILEKIITLANEPTRLPFLAMVRSLRSTGCDLPVWVIPFDERKFELPDGCLWWEIPEVSQWLEQAAAAGHSMHVMRKYQCLLTSHYQFVDSDVVFLRNPSEILEPLEGFVTSCCHWTDPSHTVTSQSQTLFEKTSTTWQRRVFNSGQFACDRTLFDLDKLIQMAEGPEVSETVLRCRFHEQPGMNVLVLLSKVTVTNLTLPPWNMESTWAGHYRGEPSLFWSDSARKPYLIHWAGRKCDGSLPVDSLLLSHLDELERTRFLRGSQPSSIGSMGTLRLKIASLRRLVRRLGA